MKHAFHVFLLLLLCSVAHGQPLTASSFVQRVPLDPTRPYFVPTYPGVTVTLSFPREIEGYEGFGFTLDPQQVEGDYQLRYTENNPYISIVPLSSREAIRNLNIVVGGKVYSVIAYPAKDQRQAPTSIIFEDVAAAQAAQASKESSKPSSIVKTFSPPRSPFEKVSPARLLGMLDTMKMLAQLDAQDANEEQKKGSRGHKLDDAAKIMPQLTIVRRDRDITDCGLYRVKMCMVVRNNKLDVIAFTCVVENISDVPLVFDPESFGIRVGAAFYRQVIGDFKPTIKPGKSEVGFFAMAGSPNGRPNRLDPAQEFSPSIDLLRPRVNPGANLIKDTIWRAVVAEPAHSKED